MLGLLVMMVMLTVSVMVGGPDNDIDCEGRALVSLLAGTLAFYAV